MNKLYSVHDHWTDINKKNDVDIESIDGVITGIKVNGEDYGGSITWESVYSGSIDPEGEVSPFTADVSLTMTATDSIKVVYDGVEYVLPKQVFNEKIYYGAEPASLPADIDFTNYPFLIQVLPDTIRVYTETAGLHTLAISVPQSGGGGSSEMFKIATVTLVNNHSKGNGLNGGIEHSNTGYGFLVLASDIYEIQTNVGAPANSVAEYQAILMLEEGETPTYSTYYVIVGDGTPTVTGEATLNNEDNLYTVVVTGDCTITIS